jgi:hypothetical protein
MSDAPSTVNDLLADAWRGEILGEVAFRAFADAMPDDREIWDLLADLEARVAELVRDFARPRGVEVDESATETAAKSAMERLLPIDRARAIDLTLGYVPGAVEGYQRLLPLLPADEAWIAEELIAHERALHAHLDGVRAGTPDPARPVIDFLARHGTAAP